MRSAPHRQERKNLCAHVCMYTTAQHDLQVRAKSQTKLPMRNANKTERIGGGGTTNGKWYSRRMRAQHRVRIVSCRGCVASFNFEYILEHNVEHV